MWSSEKVPSSSGNNNRSSNRVRSTTSSSSTRASSSSPCIPPQAPRRSMEEVWKDISLSTLNQDLEAKSTTTTTSFSSTVLQDYLAGAFNDPSPVWAPLSELPLRGLSLNSGHLALYPNSGNSNTDGGASSAGLFACCSKKRALEQQLEASFGDGDGAGGRQKRMIKNRESAARSRARKQAYTHGLQHEVARLLDENRKLKRMYEELRLAMEAQIPAKRTLQRTSTASF